MAHLLVKILFDEDGEPYENKHWHYVVNTGGSNNALCTGEVFGYGEGNAKVKTKIVQKGGITCEECIAFIKLLKEVKL